MILLHLFQKLNIKQTRQNQKKKLDVTNFVKKAKLTELENKIPDFSSLAIKTALTALNFDKKAELEKKLTDPNHDK